MILLSTRCLINIEFPKIELNICKKHKSIQMILFNDILIISNLFNIIELYYLKIIHKTLISLR